MSFPPESSAASPCQSRWQTAYRRYREFEQELTDDPTRQALLTLLREALAGRHVFSQWLADYRQVRRNQNKTLPDPSDSFIRALLGFADLRSSYDSGAPSFVFEDVYHLAFHQLSSWRKAGEPVPRAEQCQWLYRGQRVDHWEVRPSIYRSIPEGAERLVKLQELATIACQFGEAIARKFGIPFVDGMAIAQHYSAPDVLGVSTWLIDFSRDPWVGLFFATDGGTTGDCGIVWDIMPKEYSGHAAGDRNPLGQLQLIVPPGVPRIDNQAGVFLAATHPELFKQYVAFGWGTRFRQFDGLIFEDPLLGITRNTIYPSDDPVRTALAEIRQSVLDCACKSKETCQVPASLFADPREPKTYEELLICWLNQHQSDYPGRPEPTAVRAILPELARFHALLHSAYADRLPSIVSRSVNRLRTAFENLYFANLRGDPISLRNAIISCYVMYSDQEHQTALLAALNEITPRV